ncbi:MAG TPA: hypothetical protein VFA72_10900 [Burkholderiales bacterium]|nr:hypothetical protein [Burkholderiales bacterium]
MISTQLSARAAAVAAVLFAAICGWLALDAFSSPPGLDNPDQLSGGASFAVIWTLLAAVGFAIGWFSWRQGTR